MSMTPRHAEPQDAAARQPARSDAPAIPDTAMQAEDAGTPASGNQGSPAAPAMKQFAKTEAESGGGRR